MLTRRIANDLLKNAQKSTILNISLINQLSGRQICSLTSTFGQNNLINRVENVAHLPPTIISKRYFPKPRKNTQYKFDFRVMEGKEYTADPLKLPKLGGRDPVTLKKHNQRVGGGVSFDYYWITAYPYIPPEGGFYEERVLEVRTDPNRSAFIALLAGQRGRRWTIAVDDWEAGDIIRTNNHIPEIPFTPRPKEIWPVGALAENTTICMLEVLPGAKDFEEIRAYAAGGSATVVTRRDNLVVVKLASQKEVLVDRTCMCTVGRVSNPGYDELHWGSMNMKRRMGIKQGSGLWHRKDGYCGRKIRPLPPPLLPARREPPPKRYVFTMDVSCYQSGFGTNEFNPVLKGC